MSKKNTIESPHRNWAVLLLDLGISSLASLVAVLFVRWMLHPIPGFQYYAIAWVLSSLVVSLVSFIASGTHKIVIRHSSYRSISQLARATLLKELILSVILWTNLFQFESTTSEILLILTDLFVTLLLLILVRVIIITAYENMQDTVEANVDRLSVVVYGTSSKSVSMVTRLEQSTHYNVIGFLTPDKSQGGQVIQNRKVYYFENEHDVEWLKVNLGLEGVLFSRDEDSDNEQDGLVPYCLHLGIHLLMSPRVEEVDFGGMDQHAVRQIIDNDFIPDGMTAFERQTKRIIDCILAAILLVVFSPLFLICYLALKIGDPGPAIYKQERIGRFGRPFNIYKFRSMRTDAEAGGPALYAGDDDPRLTKVGKFLRQHHLDELPQLWNVFVGDMAFIGWRPERKFYIDKIMEIDPRYYYLYQIRPGVTSYATLNNGYTDTMDKMLRRLEFDLYYLRHRSLWFDIKVLWLTFMNIVFGKKF